MKFVLFFVTISAIAVISCYADTFKCTEGVPYIENHCNNCVCAKGGLLACTEKLCIGQENQAKCKAGDTWNEGCNQCWCDEPIGTVCTNNEC